MIEKTEDELAQKLRSVDYLSNDGSDKITDDCEGEINFNAIARAALTAINPDRIREEERAKRDGEIVAWLRETEAQMPGEDDRWEGMRYAADIIENGEV